MCNGLSGVCLALMLALLVPVMLCLGSAGSPADIAESVVDVTTYSGESDDQRVCSVGHVVSMLYWKIVCFCQNLYIDTYNSLKCLDLKSTPKRVNFSSILEIE